MCGGAHQDLAAEFRLRQVFVALEPGGAAALLVEHDDARAARHAVPLPVRIAQRGRHAALQDVAARGGQDIRRHRAREARAIHRDQHIGRRIRPFRLDARDELVGIALDQADAQAGLGGEAVIQRAVGVVVARGIERQRALLREGGAREGGGGGKGEEVAAAHGVTLAGFVAELATANANLSQVFLRTLLSYRFSRHRTHAQRHATWPFCRAPGEHQSCLASLAVEAAPDDAA